MSPGLSPSDSSLERLRALAATIEAHRPLLGATVDAMLAPLLAEIAGREGQAAAPLPPLPTAIVEERKVVTVLMADISGFTAMSEKMDPEAVRDLINASFDHLVPCIDKYGGTVEKFIGDEIMAMFGAPVAHENDAERAVRAALEMLQALVAFNAKRQTNLGMHIGINTGLVLAGAIGTREHQQYGVTGDTVNLGARLLHAAQVGQIFIGHTTYRQVRGLFEVEAQEPLTLKGKSEPVRAYSVLRDKPRSIRLEHRGIEGVETHMVGREAELAALRDLYALVQSEESPRLALIVGEAGLGKSRLLHELMGWIEKRNDQPWLLRGWSRPDTASVPFSFWRAVWSDQFGLADDEPSEITRQIFEQGIAELWYASGGAAGVEPAEAAHIIGYLMGIDWPDSPYLGPLRANAQLAQGRAFHLLQQLFARMGAMKPVVVVLEDLHWADSASMDLIDFLLEAGSDLPLFLLGTARPDVFDRFPRLPSVSEESESRTVVRLQPLSGEAAQILLQEIFQQAAELPTDLVERITQKAEGNPYYLEEMVKVLVERRVMIRQPGGWQIFPERAADLQLPDTLQGLLQSRLDALPAEEKSIAQRAAVVGRVFWAGAVAATEEVAAVIPTLQHLAERDMVYQRETSEFAGEAEFTFKHALLCDVAYEALPRKQRRVYHGKVAGWLEDRTGDDPLYAAQLGEHYEKADVPIKAITHYRQGAQAAAQRFANHEAVDLLSRALRLTDDQGQQFELLSERERAFEWLGQRSRQREDVEHMLTLAREQQSASGEILTLNRQANLFARTGESALASSTAERALQLARGTVQHAEEAQALRTLGNAAFYNAQWSDALRFFHESLAAAGEMEDFALKADNLNAIGATHNYMGNYGEALQYLDQARQLVEAAGDDWRRARILSNSSMVEAMLGHYQVALEQKKEVLELQRQMGNRQSEAIARTNLGAEYHRLGLYELAEETFGECCRIFAVLNSPWGLSNNLSNRALTHIELGNLETALFELGEAEQMISGKGVAQGVVLEIFNRRALAHIRGGNADRAGEVFAEAQHWLDQASVAPDKGQLALFWTYRAETELLKGDAFAAVGHSEQAMRIANSQKLGSDILREVLLTRFRALQGSAQKEAAQPILAQARQLVVESADGLDETLREAFLGRVTINRMILASAV